MSATLKGRKELEARFRAIGDTSKLLRKFAPGGLAEIKRETPYRTRNLSRNNVIASVTDTEIRYANKAAYAAPVHEGSRPHDIVPRRASVLAFPAAGSATRAGRVRRGGQVIFAKRVRHPGNKANPFMLRGLRKAIEKFGFGRSVVETWDRAG